MGLESLGVKKGERSTTKLLYMVIFIDKSIAQRIFHFSMSCRFWAKWMIIYYHWFSMSFPNLTLYEQDIAARQTHHPLSLPLFLYFRSYIYSRYLFIYFLWPLYITCCRYTNTCRLPLAILSVYEKKKLWKIEPKELQ